MVRFSALSSGIDVAVAILLGMAGRLLRDRIAALDESGYGSNGGYRPG